jgi:hypothetical protein
VDVGLGVGVTVGVAVGHRLVVSALAVLE